MQVIYLYNEKLFSPKHLQYKVYFNKFHIIRQRKSCQKCKMYKKNYRCVQLPREFLNFYWIIINPGYKSYHIAILGHSNASELSVSVPRQTIKLIRTSSICLKRVKNFGLSHQTKIYSKSKIHCLVRHSQHMRINKFLLINKNMTNVIYKGQIKCLEFLIVIFTFFGVFTSAKISILSR